MLQVVVVVVGDCGAMEGWESSQTSSKNCRKLSNFGFINCLVGSFLFVFWEKREREREPISVKLNEMMSSKGHNSCLPCQAKKSKLYGDRENKWNCNEIDQESVLFSFNYFTHIPQFTFELFLISVLVGLKYRTKRKRKKTSMILVFIWFILLSRTPILIKSVNFRWFVLRKRAITKKGQAT